MLSITAFVHVANSTTSIETFKPIPGFPGYSASDLGRIRGRTGAILSPSTNDGGYRILSITDMTGKRVCRSVHRLVMLAHAGQPPIGTNGRPHDVCHRDGDPTNNRLSNLRYDSRAANMADSRAAKDRLPITDAMVREILADRSMTIAQQAMFIGLPEHTIRDIRYGHTYRHFAPELSRHNRPPAFH